MIKTILVPSSGDESDIATFTAALRVAKIFAAHIDVLHVRLDPVEVAVAMTTDAGGGAMSAGIVNQLEADAGEREAKAQRGFAEFCKTRRLPVRAAPATAPGRPSAQWHVETGDEPRWMSTYGLTADLIVASRGDPKEDSAAGSNLEAVLLESGRPLLIPSAAAASPAVGGSIAIAWKPTVQAARAVAAAMPFLARAKKVVVMTVEEADEGHDDEAGRLVSHLAWHGIKATAQRLKPDSRGAAETLFAAATKKKAWLLVMGGYGHSQLREWVFGGFTQQVLAGAPLSVLMVH